MFPRRRLAALAQSHLAAGDGGCLAELHVALRHLPILIGNGQAVDRGCRRAAREGGLWGPALLLARGLGEAAFADTAAAMAQVGRPGREALAFSLGSVHSRAACNMPVWAHGFACQGGELPGSCLDLCLDNSRNDPRSARGNALILLTSLLNARDLAQATAAPGSPLHTALLAAAGAADAVHTATAAAGGTPGQQQYGESCAAPGNAGTAGC